MAYILADAVLGDIRESRGAYVTEEIEPNPEDLEFKQFMTELRGSFDDTVIKGVARMHQQLGHPTPERLAAELTDLGYDKDHSSCARRYRCEACLKRKRPMLFKPAKLSLAKSFNDTVDIDVFHMLWNDEKKLILSILDEYSRYEVDAVLTKEDAQEEIQALENSWISWAGPPRVLRLDMAGWHMSNHFKEWAGRHAIKLDFVPKEAHFMLGIVERNHAVRREQIDIYHDLMPNDDLKTAVLVTCNQRNRLRGVRGSTPAMIALGQLPRQAGNADEPRIQNTGNEFLEDMKKREAAAIAFIKANNSRAVRTALMARGRPTRNEYFVGEYVYYWRKDGDPHLQKCHWRGPALVSMIEPSPSTPTPRVYWLVHGTSLIRCVHEQLRPELPEERSARPVQTSRR